MKNVIVTTNLPKEGFAQLGADYHVIFPKKETFSRNELLQLLPTANVLVSAFNYKIDSELIAASNLLKLIANFGVGFKTSTEAASETRHCEQILLIR